MNSVISTMPKMGLGTYGRRDKAGQKAIEQALEIGYRHLDTAQDYHTEAQCGQALITSGLNRQEVFLTTKVKAGNLDAGLMAPSIRQSLDLLQVSQADLVLIHWPSPNNEVALEVYLEQLGELKTQGLTQHIGVSNFTINLLDTARSVLGDNVLLTNQVEVHPFLRNKTLTDYCTAHSIGVTCYMPLAHARVSADPHIQQIAKDRGVTTEQVSLAFLMQLGFAVIPSSASPVRLKSNFEAQSLELTAQEMAIMERTNKNLRLVDPEWGPTWDV